jgi:hypothetical protein
MSIRTMVVRLGATALLSFGVLAAVASPAHASAAATPCAPNGFCDNRFCTTVTSFGSGNFWYGFAGRNDFDAGWEEYYLVGGTWVDVTFFEVNCPAP